MRSVGIDLTKFVIVTTEGEQIIQFATDPDTAVYLANIDPNTVEDVLY